jgi:hypothetical protein
MTHAQATLQQAAEFSGALFHPRMEHLFATSDVRGNIRLRDTRMAFGPLRQRTKDGVVLKVTCTNSWLLYFQVIDGVLWFYLVRFKDSKKIRCGIHPA